MSRVEYRNLQSSPPGDDFTLWEDEFGVGGANIATVRAAYAFMVHAQIGSNSNPCDEAPSIGVVNSGLRFTGQGSAQPITGIWVPLRVGGALHVSQFAEGIVRWNNPAGFTRGGFSLMNTADQRGGAGGFNANYQWGIAPDLGSSSISQTVNNTVTTLATIALPAAGSKVAFAADFETTPGSVVLTVWDDEVLLSTFTDATIVSTVGVPGMFTRNFTLNNFIEFNSFRCGTLNHLEYYV